MSTDDTSPASNDRQPEMPPTVGGASQAAPGTQWAPYGEAPTAPRATPPSSEGTTGQGTPGGSQWYAQAEDSSAQAYGQTYGQPQGQPYGQPQGQPYGQPYGQPQGQAYGQPYGQPQGQVYGQPFAPQGAYAATAPKSMVVAILLAFFLGTLGVHNFYLGFTQKGIVQLVITVIGWATSVLIVGLFAVLAVGVWVIVDIIQIATRQGQYVADANGVPLQ